MVITEFLERNARLYGSDTALVELNPSQERDSAVTWREASLIESAGNGLRQSASAISRPPLAGARNVMEACWLTVFIRALKAEEKIRYSVPNGRGKWILTNPFT